MVEQHTQHFWERWAACTLLAEQCVEKKHTNQLCSSLGTYSGHRFACPTHKPDQKRRASSTHIISGNPVRVVHAGQLQPLLGKNGHTRHPYHKHTQSVYFPCISHHANRRCQVDPPQSKFTCLAVAVLNWKHSNKHFVGCCVLHETTPPLVNGRRLNGFPVAVLSKQQIKQPCVHPMLPPNPCSAAQPLIAIEDGPTDRQPL